MPTIMEKQYHATKLKNRASEIAFELYSFKAADCRFEIVFPACNVKPLTQYLAGNILYI